MRCPLVPHGAVLQPSSAKSLPGKTNRNRRAPVQILRGINLEPFILVTRTGIARGSVRSRTPSPPLPNTPSHGMATKLRSAYYIKLINLEKI